jgi:hypothetical protein
MVRASAWPQLCAQLRAVHSAPAALAPGGESERQRTSHLSLPPLEVDLTLALICHVSSAFLEARMQVRF